MRELFGEYQCGIICENSEDGIYDMLHNVLEQADFSPYIDYCKIRAKRFYNQKENVRDRRDIKCIRKKFYL